jgi:hypothetical protein
VETAKVEARTTTEMSALLMIQTSTAQALPMTGTALNYIHYRNDQSSFDIHGERFDDNEASGAHLPAIAKRPAEVNVVTNTHIRSTLEVVI